MTLFTTLMLGHLLGDFLLQTNWVFNFKTRSWVGIAIHTLIHLVATALLLHNWDELWSLFITLGILHFATDWVKIRYPSSSQTFDFILDQIAHLIVIILCTLYWGPVARPILPLEIMINSIYYAALPAVGILIWVIAIELSLRGYGHLGLVNWVQNHLLRLSQYVSVPLLALLPAFLLQGVDHNFYVSAKIEGQATVVMRPFNQNIDIWRWQNNMANKTIYMSLGEQLIVHQGQVIISYLSGRQTRLPPGTQMMISALDKDKTLTFVSVEENATHYPSQKNTPEQAPRFQAWNLWHESSKSGAKRFNTQPDVPRKFGAISY